MFAVWLPSSPRSLFSARNYMKNALPAMLAQYLCCYKQQLNKGILVTIWQGLSLIISASV